MLNKFINVGSVIITDICPEYLYFLKEFYSIHNIRNHITDFKNEEGLTANTIEYIRSNFKVIIKQDMY